MNTFNIQPPQGEIKFSFFVLGFRPFFLAAGVISVVSMLVWVAMYGFGFQLRLGNLPSHFWHAHEMVYGFTMAVVSGFLLTAIKNWTGVQTIQYRPLLILFLMWIAARLCMLLGADFYIAAAVFDLSFSVCLFLAVLQPIVKVKQWKQMGIVSKIFLMAVFNSLFYLGLFGFLEQGIYWGIYGGLFLLLALVLTMGRRVMPFFIEKGVGYQVKLKNSLFLDRASLFIFLALTISEVFLQDAKLSSYIAAPLFVISSIRLYNWHTKGIWKAPLLWGIYSAFIFITFGFLLFALLPYVNVITHSLALHAFTVGGLAIVTLSMMSRVTLGHTGRGVKQPSEWINVAQWLLLLGVICRVVLPLFFDSLYFEWVVMSQLLWIAGFALFVVVNYPLLTQPRVDGTAG
jgi:uncharacterized protein involved in response to NO